MFVKDAENSLDNESSIGVDDGGGDADLDGIDSHDEEAQASICSQREIMSVDGSTSWVLNPTHGQLRREAEEREAREKGMAAEASRKAEAGRLRCLEDESARANLRLFRQALEPKVGS